MKTDSHSPVVKSGSDELLQLFMHHSPIYAYIKDVTPTESTVLMASENYIDMIGVAGSQMVGKTMQELFPPEFAEKISADDWTVVSEGKPLKLEEELNGRYYTTIKFPISQNGKNLLAGYTIDITDTKQSEEEIRRKNVELSRLIAEKDKFFSLIAHDLRSPFNAFLGFTQLLVEDLPELKTDEIRNIALIMRNSATNIYRLLENLLEWSMIQRNLTRFDPEQILLLPKVEESMELVMETAAKKGVEVRIEIPKGLVIFADANMLGSVIRNLGSNAVKFTPKGGSVLVSAQTAEDRSVTVTVKDTGIGMDDKTIGALFRLDEQSSRKGTQGEPSSGLGLIISKDFILRHGGRIWVESEVGQGSTFFINLPGNAGMATVSAGE